MGNTFGQLFRATTFGESHGQAVGAVVDGCPPNLKLSVADIQADLDRRRPGQSALVSQRNEADQVQVLSGVEDGRTLGTPIALVVGNRDARPADYAALARAPRPSHADYTWGAKYGIHAASGGGRASARETVGRVAAGAIARHLLAQARGVEIVAWVAEVHSLAAEVDGSTVSRQTVDAHPMRCPDPVVADRMQARVLEAKAAGDSLGGVVAAVARGVPVGWGEPVVDKLEADLAKAMLSLPAARGFEVGSGFDGAQMTGSAHNDAFVARAGGGLGTATNRSGGIQGGISNGEPISIRVAFKPTSTLGQAQATVDAQGQPISLAGGGRHDPCVLPRAAPIVEAMLALVLADHMLRHLAVLRLP